MSVMATCTRLNYEASMVPHNLWNIEHLVSVAEFRLRFWNVTAKWPL